MLDLLLMARREFESIAVESFLSDCVVRPEFGAAFSRRGVAVSFKSDESLFRIGEPGCNVYLVRSGEVGLVLPLSDTQGFGFRAMPGSLVGLPAAFSNEPYSMTAIAWQGSEVSVMGRDRFCDLVASSSALSLDVLKILAAETRAARVAIVEASAKRRISKCL
jgi:CRP-like cAMP-binding protein